MNAEIFIGPVYNTLTKSEMKIADLLGEDPDNFVNLSTREIAESAAVGEATIVRFLKKCGYSTLMELRYDVIRKREKMQAEPQGPLQLLTRQMEVNFSATADNIDMANIKKAATLLSKADHVYCYGIGQSGLAAEIAAYRAMRFGRQAQYVTDIHYQHITSASCQKNDAIFAFSGGGISPEILASIKVAKANHASIVGFSSNNKYGLCELSDYFFYCAGESAHRQPAGSGIDVLNTMAFAFELIVKQYVLDNPQAREIAEAITVSLSLGRE